MAEHVTFITWCTNAGPVQNTRCPASVAYGYPHQFGFPSAEAIGPSADHPSPTAEEAVVANNSARKSLELLWPGPVQLALAVLILAAATALSYQTFRTAPPGAESDAPVSQRIDLNLASEAELRLLPGIGPSLAQRIIAHRDKAGKFHSVDELRSVPGIGPTIFARLRLRVMVDETDQGINVADRGIASRPKAAKTAKGEKIEPLKGSEIINVNRAGAADLRKIPGVGPVLSKNIVDYRTAKGPFRTVEDLCKVPGIKSKMLAKIKPYITLDGEHHALSELP
jgi:competence ComEA-like helix-hairpin-helix protein